MAAITRHSTAGQLPTHSSIVSPLSAGGGPSWLMLKIAVAAGCLGLVPITTILAQDAGTQMWVKANQAERRTCAAATCGTVGNLLYRESAEVFETKAGWGRTTKYYGADCTAGRNAYVKAGAAECTAANGVKDGKFAEWVRLDQLSRDRPADPAAGATGTAALIGQSDDFHLYQAAFVKAADKLMSSGECTQNDFKQIGGFAKSTNKGKGIYFTYCGGMNRIYLDVATGRTFR